MADLVCGTCGKLWPDTTPPGYTARLFSQPSHPVGSYLSVPEMIANGESLLTCPADPQEPLGSAVQASSSGPSSSARVTGVSTRGGKSRFLDI